MMDATKIYKNAKLKDIDYANDLKPLRVRDDTIAQLEVALMYLNFDYSDMYMGETVKKTHIKRFDGAYLAGASFKHSLKEEYILPYMGEYQATVDMFKAIDFKMLHLGGKNDDSTVHMSRWKMLSNKEKRHLEPFRNVFRYDHGFLNVKKERWFTQNEGFGVNGLVKKNEDIRCYLPYYTSTTPGYGYDPNDVLSRMGEILDKESPYYMHWLHFHLMLQMNMSMYYEWNCYIREGSNSLGIRIPIHPSSSKEVFLMRNIPEGAKRRKAIVNFVKDHYRTIKGHNDNERKVLIKKHFRGELKFNWRGLEVHVTPSQYDLNRVKTTKNFLKL